MTKKLCLKCCCLKPPSAVKMPSYETPPSCDSFHLPLGACSWLSPCTNVSATSLIFRPAGDLPCPPMSLGGKRHSCRDELTPFHNCKMASKDISHPISLEGRASCQSLHTQLLPVLIALWSAQDSDVSHASLLQLLPSVSTSTFWERVSLPVWHVS